MAPLPAQHFEHSDPAREFRTKIDLLCALGRSLHEVGLPAHELEEAIGETATRCDVKAEVFSMPTALWMTVGEGDNLPVALLLRVDPGAPHLERMSRLSAVARALALGKLEPGEALGWIERIMRARTRWGPISIVLAYLLSAAAFAVFFHGGLPEVLTSMCVGLVVGLLSTTFQQRRASRRMFELTAAAAAAIIADLASNFIDPFVEWIPLAAGLIILLPGLALVDAVEELAHGHLTSGSARMAGVGVVLLAMTFGAVLGMIVVPPDNLDVSTAVANPLPSWTLVPALAAVAVGSTIRFRARPSDVSICLVASTIALVGSRVGSAYLGVFAGPFMAAFLLGLSANLFARFLHRPAELLTVPGLAMLVPGSFGVQSIAALLSEDTILGIDTGFHMFVTAMALATGLLFSNAMYRPRSWL
jgi:uncharacterized membrane protein YjjP (DUF1212 family)